MPPRMVDPATIQLRPVRGTVRIGGEPIASRLIFRAPALLRSVTTSSNDEGEFQALLPDAGTEDWNVTVSIAELSVNRVVKVTVPKNEDQSIAIDLPAWTVTGIVVKADGTPVSGAIVDVVGDDEMPFTQTMSIEDERSCWRQLPMVRTRSKPAPQHSARAISPK
jgi:hypothetical protein